MTQPFRNKRHTVDEGHFVPFSQERLSQFIADYAIAPEAVNYINAAYEAPSRNVQGGTKNLASDIPCPKMMAIMPSESWSTEYMFALDHIFDSRTLGYLNQPPPINVKYVGRNGKKVRGRYTPDSLVLHFDRGVYLEEYKSASDRPDLLTKHPGKYAIAPDGSVYSSPIESELKALGIKFGVRFSDEIDPVGHSNRVFLLSYLFPSSHFEWEHIKDPLLQAFGGVCHRTYDDLVQRGADVDALNWAIATRHLHIDFNDALIETESHMIQVFTSSIHLQVWNHAIRPNGERPLPGTVNEHDLTPGQQIIYDGVHLTVALVGATALHTFDDSKRPVVLTQEQLQTAREAGTLVLPVDLGLPNPPGRLWSATVRDLERALSKLEILESLEHGVKLKPDQVYSDSTFRRWRKSIKDGASSGLSAVEALIDDTSARGYHGPHISDEYDAFLTQWIRNNLSDKTRQTIEVMYSRCETASIAHGFEPIGRSSFYERVKKIRSVKTIEMSAGHKNAYPLSPTHWMLHLDTPLHCTRAMELVHIDSTLLDVDLRSSITGESIGKPWLTLAMCAHTRRVVGMYLSFLPPSHVSSMMVLTDIVRRTGRLPDAVIVDWGSEFKAKCWTLALATLQIIKHVRPKSAPRFGSILERMFGKSTTEILNNIIGSTKLRKNVRTLSPLVDPSRLSGLWLIDIHTALEDYFFRIYDNTKHPTTMFTPKIATERSLIVHGYRIHRTRDLEAILPIVLPPASRSECTIDPARGVFVNGRYYGHPKLADLSLKGSKVPVRAAPFDPGFVIAQIKGHWTKCTAGISARLSRLPRAVVSCIYEELRIERRIVKLGHRDARKETLKLIESLNAKAKANIKYWEDEAAQEALAVSDIDPPANTPRTSSSYTDLERMVQEAVARQNSTRKGAQ